MAEPTLNDLESMADAPREMELRAPSSPSPASPPANPVAAPSSGLDDDYHNTLVERGNQRDLEWFNDQAGQMGVEGVDQQPKDQPQGEQQKADQSGWTVDNVIEGAKTVGKDLAGIPGNMGHIAVGGAMRSVQAVNDLTKATSDWLERHGLSLGGLKVYDKDGKFNPELLGPEAWDKFKQSVGAEKASGLLDVPNVGGLMDRPKDSVSAAMLQSVVQFLTGFGMAGKVAPSLKLAKEVPSTMGGLLKESAKVWTRAEITEFAAFDGQEGNLANLMQTVPMLSGPVTDFLATNEETPELVGRLKNAVANAPFNLPFDVFIGQLRALREARKIKSMTGAETYQEAATKLAEGGVDPAEGQAQPMGSKLDALLGREDEDIVKFIDPHVQQTQDQQGLLEALRKAYEVRPDEMPNARVETPSAQGGAPAAMNSPEQRYINRMRAGGSEKSDAELLAQYQAQIGKRNGPMFAAGAQTDQAVQDALGYTSKALEAAKSLKQLKGTPEQMRAQLRSAGVKEAELQALDVDTFLEGKKSITRDDLIKYLEDNKVGVREVGYGGAVDNVEVRKLGYGQLPQGYGIVAKEPEYRGGPVRERFIAGPFDTEEAARSYIPQAIKDSGVQGNTKWSRHSLDPNNPTYRETVLHLPTRLSQYDSYRAELSQKYADQYGGGHGKWPLTPDERAKFEKLQNDAYLEAEGDRKPFQQHHFPDQQNVVAHLMTSVNKHEGASVFTLDQIQSDWGQKLRDGGVRDEGKIATMKEALKNAEAVKTADQAKDFMARANELTVADIEEMYGYSNPKDYVDNVKSTADRLRAELRTAEASSPGHPLVNTTDQWTSVALKRAIRQAVEQDAEYISIPSGKTVESYNPQGDSAGNAVFYDQIVPKNLRNILRKIDKESPDGVRVDKLETPTKGKAGDGFTVFKLTDKVKQSVLADGQPLFATKGQDVGKKYLQTIKAREASVKSGQEITPFETVGPEINQAYQDRAHRFPEGTKFGHIASVVKANETGGVRVNYLDADGQAQSVLLKGSDVLGGRAVYIPATDTILSVRFDAFGNLGKAVAGEINHEIVHGLRRNNLIPASDWSRLVGFAHRMGILDADANSYLVAIGEPTAAETALSKISFRDSYAKLYAGRANYQEIMDQEAVAHLMEFVHHDLISKEDLAPIADLIQKFRDGGYTGKVKKPAVGPRSDNPNAIWPWDQPKEWDKPLLAAGADTAERGAAQAARQPGKMFVNWSRINSPDDVKTVMQTMADQFSHEIDLTRRGVRTNAQTMQAAGDENAWKLLIGERKGNLPSAEEQLALRQLWAASGEKLMEVAKLASAGGDEEMFAFRRMLAVHNTIQQQVIGMRTETARALQQWKIPAGGDKEKLNQLKFAINSNGGSDVTKALAERIAILADRPGFEGAVDQMVRKGAFAKTMDAVREAWINAILSGPKTHIVNMMSNASVVAQSMLERAVAGRVGDVLDPVEGVRIGEATAMWWGVKSAMKDALIYSGKALRTGNSGFGRGQVEGPRVRALSYEMTGQPTTALGMGLDMLSHVLGYGLTAPSRALRAVTPDMSRFTQSGNKALRAIGKAVEAPSRAASSLINPDARGLDAVGEAVNLPGRFLQAEDEFFKTINYRAELHAQAFRQASEEVDRGALAPDALKGRIADLIDNPPENLRLKAADMATYNTFQQEPGPISKKLIAARNAIDDTVGFPLGTMIMPFVNTPGNIMKYTFERTPLAPLASKFRADLAAGGARRDLALARIGLGTILVGTAYDLALNGHITGSGPGDKATGERQALRRSGWQPYSIKVRTGGTDEKPEYRWFAYNRLDPIGSLFGMSAELAEMMRNSENGQNIDTSEAISGLVLGASQTYMNKSYLTGLSGLIEAMHDPDRYGESWWNKTMSSVVPAIVAEAARYNDPVMRYNYDTLSAMKRRIPGLSTDLPPRLNFWGEPITYQSGLGSLYDMVSPIYSNSNVKAKGIDREFFNIDYFPTHPSSLRIEGKNISLRNDPEVKNRIITLTSSTKASTLVDDNFDDMASKKGGGKSALNRLMNFGDQTLPEALTQIIKGEDPTYGLSYLDADADEKKKILGDVIRSYRAAAQAQALREFPKLKQRRDEMPTREDMAEPAPF